jgi:hypothetical protein
LVNARTSAATSTPIHRGPGELLHGAGCHSVTVVQSAAPAGDLDPVDLGQGFVELSATVHLAPPSSCAVGTSPCRWLVDVRRPHVRLRRPPGLPLDARQ